jgi:undecaprenyl diphosphate synthase
MENIPTHIAIIMDGNARWAKGRNLPVIAGHKKGAEVIEEVALKAKDVGVKILTLYAFSTENWNRPKAEVNALMQLLYDYLKSNFVKKMMKNNVKLSFIGNLTGLSDEIQSEIEVVIEKTKNNDSFVLNIALNYGGRDEIIRAVNSVLKDKLENVTAEKFEAYLDTKNLETPDPDLLIRTGGDMRVSNFLLWQIAYSEIFVSDVYWPDFGEKELKIAISAYQERKRRYGGRIE